MKGKRLTPGEKLAREICWNWLPHRGRPQGKTKAQYWKALPESTRQNYRADATQFVFILSRLPIDIVNLAHDLARAKRS